MSENIFNMYFYYFKNNRKNIKGRCGRATKVTYFQKNFWIRCFSIFGAGAGASHTQFWIGLWKQSDDICDKKKIIISYQSFGLVVATDWYMNLTGNAYNMEVNRFKTVKFVFCHCFLLKSYLVSQHFAYRLTSNKPNYHFICNVLQSRLLSPTSYDLKQTNFCFITHSSKRPPIHFSHDFNQSD